jgi:hypothetical protein
MLATTYKFYRKSPKNNEAFADLVRGPEYELS